MKGHVFSKIINTDNFYYSEPEEMTGDEFTENAKGMWSSLVIIPNNGTLKYKPYEDGFLIFGEAYGFSAKTKNRLLEMLNRFKAEFMEECASCKIEFYEGDI